MFGSKQNKRDVVDDIAVVNASNNVSPKPVEDDPILAAFKKFKAEVEIPDHIEELQYDPKNCQITFNVVLNFENEEDNQEFSCVLTIPRDSYPNGTYELMRGTDLREHKGNDLTAVMKKIFQDIEDDFLTETVQYTQETETQNDDYEEDDEEMEIEVERDDTDFGVNPSVPGLDGETKKKIETDIAAVRSVDGWFSELGVSGTDSARVYLIIDPKKRINISNMVANAWGIDKDRYIVLQLTFSGHYVNAASPPPVECFQSGNVNSKNGNKLENPTKFGLYWTCQQRVVEKFWPYNWPISKYEEKNKNSKKNYVYALMEFIESVITNCNKHCLVCGSSVPFEGLKPTVCPNPLCVFSHEMYGLGVDLGSEIKAHPDIVDLMITMGVAACNSYTSNYTAFEPFPEGVEVKRVNPTTGEVEVLSFMNNSNNNSSGGYNRHGTAEQNSSRNFNRVKECLEKIPALTKLQQWQEANILKAELDKLDPLAYPLLRWLLASNRSHLKKLKPKEMITEMNTPHQYILMSSSPEREKEFQALKKQYGSFFAWHGSPLPNWHAILRSGLKNMSGTKGQLHGAAYGSGVYLAATSSVSFGYARTGAGWSNSVFGSSGSLGCLALVEVIDHPDLKGMPNPYYVVKNDRLVMTRYFFIYSSPASVDVIAKKVHPPKIDDS
eukprot:GEZU01005824.1.p1 GENE.GEZU01005824.1~~GEZU01005824.1.p1  ORF type:complete len:667 (+),score=191.50 GEZU01005824.1:150-2150(+)